MSQKQSIGANWWKLFTKLYEWRVMLCIPKTIDNLLYEWWALATGKMQKKFWQTLSFGVAWKRQAGSAQEMKLRFWCYWYTLIKLVSNPFFFLIFFKLIMFSCHYECCFINKLINYYIYKKTFYNMKETEHLKRCPNNPISCSRLYLTT